MIKLSLLVFAGILFVFNVIPTWQPTSVLADEINEGVYAIDSEPGGKSYEEWVIEYWQLAYNTPAANHPVIDETGELCMQDQLDSPVLFLFFSSSGGAERTCDNVPPGRIIFVGVNTVACSFAELDVETEEELHTCAEEDESSNPGVFLSVDGREIVNVLHYRVHTDAYDINIPADAWVGDPGPSRAVSDGYYVMLEPLSPGRHDIHFKASLSDPVTNILFYSDDLIYHLNVAEGEESGSIPLLGTTTNDDFKVQVDWTPNDIGSENTFGINIMNAEGTQLADATYDVMIYKGDQHLDETHRSGQTASEQKYAFAEAGSYSIRIENINGSGESNQVTMPMNVTPEFPIGLFALLGIGFGLILVMRKIFMRENYRLGYGDRY